MKKHFYIIVALLSLLSFPSCDDRDAIRDDLNALSSRLDALQVEFDKLNDNINTFYSLASGKIYFTSYTMDENGNYTLTLSNGQSWTVYSGKPEGELPTMSVNENGEWVFNYNGVTTVIGPAYPTNGNSGVIPQISIDIEGYWCYQFGDGEVHRIEGPYNIADISSINPSIFEFVTENSDGSLNFKLYGDTEGVNIKPFGGMDMAFESSSIEVTAGASKTITATLTNVETVVISPSPLNVVLTEAETNNLTVSAPAGTLDGEYTVYFEIYSANGYRLLKELKVTVMPSNNNKLIAL